MGRDARQKSHSYYRSSHFSYGNITATIGTCITTVCYTIAPTTTAAEQAAQSTSAIMEPPILSQQQPRQTHNCHHAESSKKKVKCFLLPGRGGGKGSSEGEVMQYRRSASPPQTRPRTRGDRWLSPRAGFQLLLNGGNFGRLTC